VNGLIRRSVTSAAALLLLATAACGGGGDSGSAEQDDDATPQSRTSAATTLETAKSDLGEILVDAEGMTLYMFDPDEQGQSVCDAGCLEAWPVVEGPVTAGAGVDASLLGTAKATDGSTMATYNDWPLYYFVQDEQAGDVTGQGDGDVWWVMSPDGRPIRQMPPAQSGGGATY
jgi:predicted lipoprotein with Yx(FWY)xxD motif